MIVDNKNNDDDSQQRFFHYLLIKILITICFQIIVGSSLNK